MIIGFEWAKDINRQRQYSYEKKRPNPYHPIPQGDIIGFEWRKDNNTQQQYLIEKEPMITSFIYHEGQYKKYMQSLEGDMVKYESFKEEGTVLRYPISKYASSIEVSSNKEM